ncbi:MAG: hypothetical protein IMX01_09875 [Limnochordaceae bacterium]|nr:hypothetical protein [Limnochordaceae bacterium]
MNVRPTDIGPLPKQTDLFITDDDVKVQSLGAASSAETETGAVCSARSGVVPSAEAEVVSPPLLSPPPPLGSHASAESDPIAVLDGPYQEATAALDKAHKKQQALVRRLARAVRLGETHTLAQLEADLGRQLSECNDRLVELCKAGEALRAQPWSLEAYARAFEAACRAESLAVDGRFPEYVAFPFSVQFHLEDGYVLVNRHKVNILRPVALAKFIRDELDRRERSSFNAARFRQALIRAHELLSGKDPNRPVSLREIHHLLSLREGSGAAGYSIYQFAFDIYRVRKDGLTEGRCHLAFIQGRRSTVTVPTSNGGKENLTALQLRWEPEESRVSEQ